MAELRDDLQLSHSVAKIKILEAFSQIMQTEQRQCCNLAV